MDDLANLMRDALVGVDSVLMEEARMFEKSLSGIVDSINRDETTLQSVKDRLKDRVEGDEFFTGIHALCSRVASNAASTYLNVSRRYAHNIRMDSEDVYALKRTVTVIPTLAKNVTDTFTTIVVRLPEDLEQAYKGIAEYNKYLKERFVKSDEVKPQNVLQVTDDNPRVKYEKVRLVDNNAVLTDLLLRFITQLPAYIEWKHKGKTIKEVSGYAVEAAA